MSRFPFGIPFGWYPVAWSFELEKGAVARRTYFSREIVLYRGESGEAFVLDAYCPHLGAHLGVGGRVEGDTLRCPFHGWRFSGAGECVEIPYASRRPASARAFAYPVREIGGLVWAWYHPKREAPAFEPPEVPEWGAEGWMRDWTHYEWTIRTHPQEIAENSVDWPHFHHIHHMEPPPERDVRFERHEIRWHAATTKNVSTLDGRADEIRVVGRNPGLGCSYVRYSGMLETVIVMGMTPVDEERVHMRFGVLGRLDGGDAAERASFHKAYADDMALAVEQDFPIWENKVYHTAPRLCDGDGPVPDFRRWAAQFYVA
jgi:3-ketosteroid 9alpha-monooxygenase subunit A